MMEYTHCEDDSKKNSPHGVVKCLLHGHCRDGEERGFGRGGGTHAMG